MSEKSVCPRMMRRNLVRILAAITAILILSCLSAESQQAAKPKSEPTASQPAAGAAPAPQPGKFYDKELDLRFNYPVEMRILDANAAMERGHKENYGESGENDPEHQQAKRCVKILLYVDLPEDKGPQRPASLEGIWEDNSNSSQQSRKPQPVYATILLMEVGPECMPKEALKNQSDTLASVAKGFLSEAGVQPVGKPLWYEVGKQKIHMNAGAGEVEIHGKNIPMPMFIMAMATMWHDHLVAWVFMANDTQIFNEITKSQAQFGKGPWGPMFGADIGPQGSGTPIKVLPK